MAQGSEFWVLDTSSLLQVRRVARTDQRRVFDELGSLVSDGQLVYPVQVVEELKRYSPSTPGSPDLPYEWARRNRSRACRHGIQFAMVKTVLDHPLVRNIVDPDKVGVEEADPYVLGLALFLRGQGELTVLTEETRDLPGKLSMSSACGLLRLVCLRMEPFLAQRGIWTPRA